MSSSIQFGGFDRLLVMVVLLFVAARPVHAEFITKITWRVDTSKLSKGTSQPFLFPLPINGFGQKVTYLIRGGAKTEVVNIPQLDNLIRIIPSQRYVWVEVTVTYDNDGLPQLSQYEPAKDNDPVPPEVRPYLKVTYGLDHTTPAIATTATTLKGKDHLDSARNVLGFVSQNVKYDYTYWRTTDEILAHKVTQCEGQSALAVALLRNLGIPARMIFLVHPNKPKGNVVDGHTIVQFYLNGSGWFMGDPGYSNIVFSTTRGILGEEPIPYYYCRKGMGALLKMDESLQNNYPQMWQYLQAPENANENTIITCMTDYFHVMYDCTVIENTNLLSEKIQVSPLSPGSMTPYQLTERLQNTVWSFEGRVASIRLLAGGKLERTNREGKTIIGARWSVNDDLTVTLTFASDWHYRMTFEGNLSRYTAKGTDNSELIHGVNQSTNTSPL
jgi:Transglutaminase-like superfamily